MALVEPRPSQVANIKVIGVGGGGGNVVNHMIESNEIKGVDFLTANTDAQALISSKTDTKIQLGKKLTKGLGAGGSPKIGKQAAEESSKEIMDLIKGSDMVFIAGGMGGGTASGAAPVIGKIAKEELGVLTVGVVTKPFIFEGTRRMVIAEEAIEKMKESVDTLIVIPNQKLLDIASDNLTLVEAFNLADSVLTQGVKGISELITTPGLINLDFADIKSIMKNAGSALLGVGQASGENRSKEAVMSAISSPLLDVSIDGARGILFNITGSSDLTMLEVEKAAQEISQLVGGDANIIFGASIEQNFKGVKITVIATGFDQSHQMLSQLVNKKEEKIDREITVDNKEIDETDTEETKKEEETDEIEFSQENLPEGVEINDKFDIPSFLRKQRK
jgi:cell division protein FtsZ